MPKLLKGMFRRGPSYYVRMTQGGRNRWICLGSEYGDACRRVVALRRGDLPVQGGSTVGEVAQRWLATYVRTARNEKQQRLTSTRVERYIGEYFRHRPLLGLRPDHVR